MCVFREDEGGGQGKRTMGEEGRGKRGGDGSVVATIVWERGGGEF